MLAGQLEIGTGSTVTFDETCVQFWLVPDPTDIRYELGHLRSSATGMVDGLWDDRFEGQQSRHRSRRRRGRMLTIEGGIRGGGRFEVSNGATLNMTQYLHLFSGSRVRSFRLSRRKGRYRATSSSSTRGDRLTTLKFTGAGDEALIK